VVVEADEDMDERQRNDAHEHPSLTVREVAGLLGLSETTVRRMLHEGLLIGRRQGRTWRIDAEAVRAYQQAQTTDTSDREPPARDGSEDAAPTRQPAGGNKAPSERPSDNQQPPAQPRTPVSPESWTLRYRASARARRLFFARPRLPRPARSLLELLARYAEHTDYLELFGRRDAEENARYGLPDGERPMLAAVWTVELYTPSSIAGLLDALERHSWLRLRGGGSPDPVQWVQDQRGRPGGGGWMQLATVIPAGARGLWLDATEGDVPEGFASVRLAIIAISSTLTGIVGCFMPTDEYAVGLNAALRREQHTTVLRNPSWGWSIHAVDQHKRAAADAVRASARRTAIDWTRRYVPGVFARGLLEDDMPTLDLILTETVEPLLDGPPARRPDRAWLDLLGLDMPFDAWTCRDVPGLKATLRSRLRDSSEHHLTLAAQRGELFSDEELDDPPKRDRRELVLRLDGLYLTPFAARWGINGLLSGIEHRLARIRDLAERSSHRGSIQMLDELRRELLAVGLDGHVVAADIIALTNEAARYDYHVLEFVEAWTPTPREGTAPAPPAVIPAALREHQQQRAQHILASERQLRDLLDTTSNLAGAVSNLRLQRWVAIITAVSTVAAIIALIVAVLALNVQQPNGPPATSLPTPTTTRQ
jgi:excisionase family DNA binding protein